MDVSRKSDIMSEIISVYRLLKMQGHEFAVITARSGFKPEIEKYL